MKKESINIAEKDIFSAMLSISDNVFIYDEALSAEEITEIRINGSASIPFEFSPSLGLLLVGGLSSIHLYCKHKVRKEDS